MQQQPEPDVSAQAHIAHIKYQAVVTSGGHSILVDEPVDLGGGDTAMAPYSLLLASLASCTIITLRMYIDRKMWIVDEIAIALELFKTDDGTDIKTYLTFKGELTDEQKKRLLNIAEACPVHKMLTGNIAISTSCA